MLSSCKQVLLSYGMYTNLELLEHYGFLLNENPNDKAFIPLEGDMYSLCPWPQELLYINQHGKPSFALLSTLRLWATPPNRRRSVGHIAYSGEQVSAENEITVMAWIVKKCCDILENLNTTPQEDKLLLRTIDKIQHFLPVETEKLPPTCISELRTFSESNGVTDLENFPKICMSRKARKAIFRWRLAINWRYDYKRRLMNCISYCNQIIDDIRCEHGSTM